MEKEFACKNEPVRGEQSPSRGPSLQQELEIARRIQSAMIPHVLPAVEGVEMAAVHMPCGQIGGDLYDIIQVADDLIAFVMFDVAGHGISSALIASMAKISFSNHIRAVHSPRSVVERVNAEMIQNLSVDFFLTAFVAFLDLHNNKLTYCNAGHPYPIVYHSTQGQRKALTTAGLFVGLFEHGMYEEACLYLSPGDWLLIFSDGVYGLFDGVNEKVQRQAFENQVIPALVKSTPAQILEQLRARQDSIVKRLGSADDDISAIAVEVLTQSRRNQIKEELGFRAEDPVYIQHITYFEEMDRAAAVILSEMDQFGYRDDSIRKMKIALTELLANAIYHGNSRDNTKKVTIGHVVNREKTTVSILDQGQGYRIEDVPDPTLPENLVKDCGRGLYIVRNYVDQFVLNPKGNCATITKLHTPE